MLGVLKLKCNYLMIPLQQLFDWFILRKPFLNELQMVQFVETRD